MKPALQLAPPAPATPAPPAPDYLETTASFEEMAEALGISVNAARKRGERGWATCDGFPSRKQYGKTETRVFVKHLSRSEKRRLYRWRRKQQRVEQNLAPHPGGLVLRADDRRVKLTAEVKQIVWALYGRREQPSCQWVFEQLIDQCPFCEKGKMTFVRRGFDARHKSARCEQCGKTLHYRTIVRACDAMPPLIRVASREGMNAAANKHIYQGRIQRGEFRNAIVVGDHHVCDIFLWDPRRPIRDGGEPRVRRYWLSAWQDEAAGVVEFALGERPNTRLILDALYRYALRWGMPAAIRTDNGKDYLSQEFLQFWKASGIEEHHKSLPSCRSGESHGKSKVIERWFGTFERDIIKLLPGWCGSHPKEKPDDVLWPQMKQHKEFLSGARAASPFLTLDAFEKRIREWTEGVYHRREQKRLRATPLAAFAAGTAPVRTLNRDALAVLMLHPEARVIRPNGVSVNGLDYWTSEFAHHKGEACQVLVDFDDLRSVVCVVGKERRILTAEADDLDIQAAGQIGEATEENRKQVHARKKVDRDIIRNFYDLQREKLSGRRPWQAILAEKAAQAQDVPMAVNGAFTPSIPMLTEAHHIARSLSTVEARSPALGKTPVRLPEDWDQPEAGLPFRLPDYVEEPKRPQPADAKPIFTTQWEKEEWEREHGRDAD